MRSAEPARAKTTTESQWMPITSVWRPRTATAATEGVGRVLNIAAGGSETVNALADTIGRLLDRPVEKTYGPAQPGDVRESWADVTAAHEAIGYAPEVGFEEGLRRTIEAMLGTEAAR